MLVEKGSSRRVQIHWWGGGDNLVINGVGKIGVFNAFLAFIFAGESRFSYICVYWCRLGRRWADHIREQQVKDYLKQLDIPRSMVLDRIHLRKLKGLATWLQGEKSWKKDNATPICKKVRLNSESCRLASLISITGRIMTCLRLGFIS